MIVPHRNETMSNGSPNELLLCVKSRDVSVFLLFDNAVIKQ